MEIIQKAEKLKLEGDQNQCTHMFTNIIQVLVVSKSLGTAVNKTKPRLHFMKHIVYRARETLDN